MSKRDLQTVVTDRSMNSVVRALDKLRQQFAVGFMKERLSPQEARDRLNEASPQERMDMYTALGPDTFFAELKKLGLTGDEDATR